MLEHLLTISEILLSCDAITEYRDSKRSQSLDYLKASQPQHILEVQDRVAVILLDFIAK